MKDRITARVFASMDTGIGTVELHVERKYMIFDSEGLYVKTTDEPPYISDLDGEPSVVPFVSSVRQVHE